MFYQPSAEAPHGGDHGLPHNPFKALISPRPIAWVASQDEAGHVNLAPFSYFNALGDAPPLLMISVTGPKAPEQPIKDTLSNILTTGEFVINLVSAAQAEAMNQSSAPYPAETDEFEAAGLEKAPSRFVRPPRVATSPAAFECRLIQHVLLPSWSEASRADLLIGEVVGVHIDDAVIRDGQVDVTLYQPLSRLGYLDYAKVERVFPMPRPKL